MPMQAFASLLFVFAASLTHTHTHTALPRPRNNEACLQLCALLCLCHHRFPLHLPPFSVCFLFIFVDFFKCVCVCVCASWSQPASLFASGAQVQIHTYIRNVFAQWHKNVHFTVPDSDAGEPQRSWKEVALGNEMMEYSGTITSVCKCLYMYLHMLICSMYVCTECVCVYVHCSTAYLHTMHENEWKLKFLNIKWVQGNLTPTFQ